VTRGEKLKISLIKNKLYNKFEISDLGLVQKYLEVEFTTTSTSIFLSQHQYVLDLLQETKKLNSRPKNIPLPSGLTLTTDMSSSPVEFHEYCKTVGKLIFLTTTHLNLPMPYLQSPVTCLNHKKPTWMQLNTYFNTLERQQTLAYTTEGETLVSSTDSPMRIGHHVQKQGAPLEFIVSQWPDLQLHGKAKDK
jgi:hypothetical protein